MLEGKISACRWSLHLLKLSSNIQNNDLEPNPIHTSLAVSPAGHSGAFFLVDMHRTGLLVAITQFLPFDVSDTEHLNLLVVKRILSFFYSKDKSANHTQAYWSPHTDNAPCR